MAAGQSLSYECLTSEQARCMLNERLDEDPSFALSVTELDHPELEDDDAVDGVDFDDDLGATADVVAAFDRE